MGDDARRYLAARHVALTAVEVEAATAYSVDSAPVNMPLRGLSPSGSGLAPTDEELLHAVSQGNILDAAIGKQVPLDEAVVTWRAIGPKRVVEYVAAVVIADPAFQSSSTNRTFVEEHYLTSDEHRLLRITLPLGVRVLHMPSVGDGGTLKAEDEVLMWHDSILRIDNIGDEFIEVTLL